MNTLRNINENINPCGNTCEKAFRTKFERYRESSELFTNKWKGEVKFILNELGKIYGDENYE